MAQAENGVRSFPFTSGGTGWFSIGRRGAARRFDDIGKNVGALAKAREIAARYGFENLRATGAKREHHTASICIRIAALNQIALDQARNQLDGAVVLDQQARGQISIGIGSGFG